MVSGSCKRDAVWNSSAVLDRQDEVEIFGAGQAVTKVISSSEEGTVDSVLACLNSIILFSCSFQLNFSCNNAWTSACMLTNFFVIGC